MTAAELLEKINSPKAAELFASLYGEAEVEAERQRYKRLIEEFPKEEDGSFRLFSVPGRTELGGNHTDHNQGKVLAASIQLDAAAVVTPRQDKQVIFHSRGHSSVKMDISDFSLREDEKGKAEAIVRGIAAELTARGEKLNGFTANIDSRVLIGSGLSSSAAVEVLFAKIFDNLFCGGQRSALELARIGQKAENIYFGKPCGLMDQTACASGGAVAIDFEDLQNPKVQKIDFDPAAAGYAFCIVDTRGNHADLTPDYAAIPAEMKDVAAFFGKSVLRELDEGVFMARLADLRKPAGDRAVLRALHFFSENHRVDAMRSALEKLNTNPSDKNAIKDFLALVRESGDSSWELLQNIYSPKNLHQQCVSLALALTKNFLANNTAHNGACRVHGGGFAETIQVYLPLDKLEAYRNFMEGIFGEGALTVLKIRPMGAVELDFS